MKNRDRFSKNIKKCNQFTINAEDNEQFTINIKGSKDFIINIESDCSAFRVNDNTIKNRHLIGKDKV